MTTGPGPGPGPGPAIVSGAVAIMSADLSRHVEVRHVAEELHYSQFYFQRIFRGQTGITPGRYLAALRIQRAKELLAGTMLRIDQVALDVGYQSQGTFSTLFSRLVGLPPGRFRSLVDQVAGHRLADVVPGPIEARGGQRVRVGGDADACGPGSMILLGVFDGPLPSGVPSAFSVVTPDRRATMLPVRPGHSVLAAAYPAQSQLTDILLDDAALLVGQCSTAGSGDRAVGTELLLRRRLRCDLPILTAMPVHHLTRGALTG